MFQFTLYCLVLRVKLQFLRPVFNSLIGVSSHDADVTGMLKKHVACGDGVVLQRLLNIYLRLGISTKFEQHPGVCVEIGCVLWLLFHCLETHLFSLLKLFARLTEIVGIVVQTAIVVSFPLQARVLGGVCLTLHLLLEVKVAHYGIEVGHYVRIARFIDDTDTFLERFERAFVVFLFI